MRERNTKKYLRWFYPKGKGRNSLKIRPMKNSIERNAGEQLGFLQQDPGISYLNLGQRLNMGLTRAQTSPEIKSGD